VKTAVLIGGRRGAEGIRLESGTCQLCKRETAAWALCLNVSSSLGRPEKAGSRSQRMEASSYRESGDLLCAVLKNAPMEMGVCFGTGTLAVADEYESATAFC